VNISYETSRIFAFSEIRPSERSERAIPQSVIGGVGFLLKQISKNAPIKNPEQQGNKGNS